ncbi:MAG TPA: TerD family protein [Alphaproteobacteria bacterium]|nr:TerD family protein [Alphaproteobacteria bacterium]HNS44199.1 TerD family protein [Alphaproteobacteria bacterium]
MTSTAAIPLSISSDGKRRLLVGLSWEPLTAPQLSEKEKKSFFKTLFHKWTRTPFNRSGYDRKAQRVYRKKVDETGREKEYDYFDLDLICLVFDNHGNLKATIGPDPEHLINESGTVYHSGENPTGIGGIADDEQIHIHTLDVPADYAHFFFLIQSDCKFTLAEIDSPRIRIADSKTEKTLLESPLIFLENQKDATACLSFHIFRKGDDWLAERSDRLGAFEDDWESVCKEAISASK